MVNVDIPSSYHMPKVSPNIQQPIEISIPPIGTQPPLSPMLSPLISPTPTWQYPPNPFSQSNSFVNMMQQHQQFFFNPLHHSLSSSGWVFASFFIFSKPTNDFFDPFIFTILTFFFLFTSDINLWDNSPEAVSPWNRTAEIRPLTRQSWVQLLRLRVQYPVRGTHPRIISSAISMIPHLINMVMVLLSPTWKHTPPQLISLLGKMTFDRRPCHVILTFIKRHITSFWVIWIVLFNFTWISFSELSSVLSDMSSTSCGGYHGSGLDKNEDSSSPTPSEYEQKRIAGFKAMQNRPTGVGYRYPNNSWSGYGLSHTAPGVGLVKNEYDPCATLQEGDIWKTSTTHQNIDVWQGDHNTSSYLDHTPGNVVNRLTSTKWPDLTTLFAAMGLEKYLGLFLSHEIDLMAFSSLTDKDLTELGVTAFGSRRKMLLAIAGRSKKHTVDTRLIWMNAQFVTFLKNVKDSHSNYKSIWQVRNFWHLNVLEQNHYALKYPILY